MENLSGFTACAGGRPAPRGLNEHTLYVLLALRCTLCPPGFPSVGPPPGLRPQGALCPSCNPPTIQTTGHWFGGRGSKLGDLRPSPSLGFFLTWSARCCWDKVTGWWSVGSGPSDPRRATASLIQRHDRLFWARRANSGLSLSQAMLGSLPCRPQPVALGAPPGECALGTVTESRRSGPAPGPEQGEGSPVRVSQGCGFVQPPGSS